VKDAQGWESGTHGKNRKYGRHVSWLFSKASNL
jgi:hypothetical protein